jgi:hypothetical protein
MGLLRGDLALGHELGETQQPQYSLHTGSVGLMPRPISLTAAILHIVTQVIKVVVTTVHV